MSVVLEGVGAAPTMKGYWGGVGDALLRDRVALIAVTVILAMLVAAFVAPHTALDPYTGSMVNRLRPIGSPHYPLGSDELGRDMMSRLICGARLSLLMGVTPVFLAMAVATALGIFAGYVGGMANMVVMRTLDVFFAFPSVLLAVALSGAMGPGVSNSIISLTIVFIPPIARVAEAVTAQVRSLDYVQAARMSGASLISVLRIHILPNVLSPVFVYASSLISISMILASGLSFLGLGVTPPEPEWGLMLNTLRAAIYVNPVVATLPGVMIFITSIAFNVASDRLRASMDVK
jgi:peptide/nickel transport system permease protein